tara:strand:- start:924 stop:2018 length:1095 start_codon:yes stop_codon:yes gene_type:complete
MLIGKELLEKVDELKKLGHEDQFIFSACGYSSEDSFNTAFFYSKNSKPISNDRQRKEYDYEVDIMSKNKGLVDDDISKDNNGVSETKNYSFLDNYTKFQMSRIKKGQKSADTDLTSIWLNPFVGEYLLAIIEEIFMLEDRQYSKEKVALACGYFDIKSPYKEFNALDINHYNDSKLIEHLKEQPVDQIKFIPRLDLFYIAIDTALEFPQKSKEGLQNSSIPNALEGLAIFKGRWCIPDDGHGGYVYIPKRIVEESKEWDYSKAKLTDMNIDYVLGYSYDVWTPPNYKEDKEYLDSYQYLEDVETAKEELDLYGFDEPMMVTSVVSYWYLDNKLDTSDWFDAEEIAEIHGLKIEDCHPSSSFRDG